MASLALSSVIMSSHLQSAMTATRPAVTATRPAVTATRLAVCCKMFHPGCFSLDVKLWDSVQWKCPTCDELLK